MNIKRVYYNLQGNAYYLMVYLKRMENKFQRKKVDDKRVTGNVWRIGIVNGMNAYKWMSRYISEWKIE